MIPSSDLPEVTVKTDIAPLIILNDPAAYFNDSKAGTADPSASLPAGDVTGKQPVPSSGGRIAGDSAGVHGSSASESKPGAVDSHRSVSALSAPKEETGSQFPADGIGTKQPTGMIGKQANDAPAPVVGKTADAPQANAPASATPSLQVRKPEPEVVTAPVDQKTKQPSVPVAAAASSPATTPANPVPLPAKETLLREEGPAAAKSAAPAGSDPAAPETKRLVKAMLESFNKECAPLVTAKKDTGMFGMFSSEDSPLVAKCLEDLDAYVTSFWSFPETADALNLMASLSRTRKDAANEAVALAKLIYLHKDSPLSAAASGRLMGLALEDLKGERQTLKVVSRGSSLPDASDRYFQFIKDIARFETSMFLKLLRPQCDDFLMRFPGHAGAEAVLFLREDSFYRENRHDLAAAGYRRILAVYPESTQRPGRLLTLGSIYDEQLKQYEDAVATYELLYTAYPDQPETLAAYQLAARIHDEKLEKYANAVALLDRIISRYPKEEAAQRALEYQAAIYTNKIRNYYSAIKAYQRLADMFKGESALNALVKAAELARNPVEDYDLQVELQGRIVAEYPASPASIQALYDSAETYAEKLKNPKQAASAYRQLLDNYPTSTLAEKAKMSLAKLNGAK